MTDFGIARVRFTPSRLSIGMGGQLTIHKLTGGDFNDNVKLWGLFLEPRLRIRTSSPTVAPCVSARVAYLRFSISIDDIAGSANGVQLNGGGGFLFRLGARTNLDLGATFGYANFEDLEATVGAGDTIGPGSGTSLVVRAGVTFGLFNWGQTGSAAFSSG